MTAVRQFVYERERVKRQPPPQRAKVLAFIQNTVSTEGRFPSRREIAEHMGWQSVKSVSDVLSSLAGDGHVRRAGNVREGGCVGAGPMTKAEQILELYGEGHTTRVIASIVYGLDDDVPQAEWDKRIAYVRVVARQRKGTGQSEIDRRYGNRPDVRARLNAYRVVRHKLRYHADPEFREKCKECSNKRFKARYQSDPDFRARHNARAAAFHRRKWKSDPEYREQRKAAWRAWYHRRKEVSAVARP